MSPTSAVPSSWGGRVVRREHSTQLMAFADQFVGVGQLKLVLDAPVVRLNRLGAAVQARETYRPSPSRASAFLAGAKSGRSLKACW